MLVCLSLCLAAACIPARTPPQLNQTPGPAVQVIDGVYDSGRFQVQAPSGWRVVTSAAGDPVTVLFAAPEGDALMVVGEGLTDAPPPAGYSSPLRSARREVTLDGGVTVIVLLHAPPADWDARLALLDDVASSIRRSQTQ
jgi:hypothetical protein